MSVSDRILKAVGKLLDRVTKSKVIWLFTSYSLKDLHKLLLISVELGMASVDVVQNLADMKHAPKLTSKNSSKPPSTDFKPNGRSGNQGKRRSGGQPGHPGSNRKLEKNPDLYEFHVPESCGCGHVYDWSELNRLSSDGEQNVDGRLFGEYDHIEFVQSPFITIRNLRFACNCPKCGRENKAPLPSAATGSPFGPNVQSLAVLLKSCHHFSYKRLQSLFDCLGCSISEGALVNMVERAGDSAVEQCKPIVERLVGSRVIASDETGCRVTNKTWYQWVFRGDDGVFHLITDSRGRDVVRSVMGDHTPEVWVSDRFSAQQKNGENHQTCLAHLARKVEQIVDSRLKELFENWMERTYDFRKSMPQMTKAAIRKMKKNLDQEMDWIVKLPTDCNVSKSVQTAFANAHEDDQLLTFANFPAGVVPATNNDCERSLRHSVIMRKVIYRFKSKKGAEGYAAIRSVLDTSALSGKNPFEAIKLLFPP